jgi:4-nitrophenyl phosphatase
MLRLIFHCIGVLWSGDHVFERVPAVLEMLRAQGAFKMRPWIDMKYSSEVGKKLVFVTNNSTKSRKDYVKKLTNLGIKANEVILFNLFHAMDGGRSNHFQGRSLWFFL